VVTATSNPQQPDPLATCILHAGMPKTGTSSIQDSLYLGLSDPRFRYIHITGHANAAHFLEAIFREDPTMFWLYRRKGFSPQKIKCLTDRYSTKLSRVLQRAKDAGATAILSAEGCWHYKANELQSLKTFVEKCGLTPHLVLYLRPIKSWIESSFQENVKYGIGFTRLDTLGDEFMATKINYFERLKAFESIFGSRNMTIKPFKRELLNGGCAVRDFCETLGISYTPQMIRRSNDGISAAAVRLLYSYNCYARNTQQPSLAVNHLLLMRLEDLKSEAFRLHSDMLAPLAKHIESQNRSILDHYCVDLQEDLHAADKGPCIRKPEDLLRFSRSSLDWLAQMSRTSPIPLGEGEATARAVASQVSRLIEQPAWSHRLRRLKNNLRLKLHGLTHAV